MLTTKVEMEKIISKLTNGEVGPEDYFLDENNKEIWPNNRTTSFRLRRLWKEQADWQQSELEALVLRNKVSVDFFRYTSCPRWPYEWNLVTPNDWL